jgi:hypothetical protein
MKTGKGYEGNLSGGVFTLFHRDDLSERLAVSGNIVLILTCHHTSQTTATP